MDRLEKLRAQKDLMRIAELNRKSEFIDEWKRAEDMQSVAPGKIQLPTEDLGGNLSSDFIPSNSQLGSRTFEKVMLPSIMNTFKTPEEFGEASDLGLQQTIIDYKGLPPAVKSPNGNRKPVQDQLYSKKRKLL